MPYRPLHLMTLLAALLIASPAAAIPVGTPLEFDTPEQEALYQGLIRELRCTVCQNQSLLDSNSGLAKDLRRNSYEMIRAGADREEIIDYMVSRYGEFVLYRTPLRGGTVLLWFGPLIFLLLGAGVLAWVVRRHRQPAIEAEPELSAEERKRLQQALKKSGQAS